MSAKPRTATSRATGLLRLAAFSTGIVLALAALSFLSVPAQAQELGMIGDQTRRSEVPMVDPLLHTESLPDAVPFVRLDKSRFADGENVFFWVGLKPTGARRPIPKALADACRLYITRPDGTTKIDNMSLAGSPVSSWMGTTSEGGWGLQEAAQPGNYELVLEFAGQRSTPFTLVVEHVPLLEKIHAAFVFDSAAAGSPVTFTVQNDSDQTIRFPRINGDCTSVWLSFTGEERQGGIQTRYPTDKASDGIQYGSQINFTNFNWKLTARVPTITLKQHATYTQALSVEDAVAGARKYAHVYPGKYKVSFGTVLQVLLGEPDGRYSKFEAVRMPVTNTAICTVPDLLAEK